MRLVQTIHRLGGRCLSIESHDFRNFHLHAERQFIVLHPAFQKLVIGMLPGVLLIEPLQGVQITSDVLGGLVGGWLQIEDG